MQTIKVGDVAQLVWERKAAMALFNRFSDEENEAWWTGDDLRAKAFIRAARRAWRLFWRLQTKISLLSETAR